jgi:hypothetical protein
VIASLGEERAPDLGARASRLTLGFVAGALVAIASVVGEGMFAAFVTSFKFDPVELATRRIFPLECPWPFFSLEWVDFGSESSWAFLGGILGWRRYEAEESWCLWGEKNSRFDGNSCKQILNSARSSSMSSCSQSRT